MKPSFEAHNPDLTYLSGIVRGERKKPDGSILHIDLGQRLFGRQQGDTGEITIPIADDSSGHFKSPMIGAAVEVAFVPPLGEWGVNGPEEIYLHPLHTDTDFVIREK